MPSFTQVQDVMKDESLGTKAAKALVTSEKAIGYFESKQFKEAIQWADSSLYYGRELNNLEADAEAQYLAGRAAYKLDSFKLSKIYLESALKNWESLYAQGSIMAARCAIELSRTFLKLEKVRAAREMAQKALTILDENPNENAPERTRAYFSLGNINHAITNYNEAIPNFEKALEWLNKMPEDDIRLKSGILAKLGTDYNYTGAPEKGINLILQAIKLNLSDETDTLALAGTYNSLAECYTSLKKYETAISYSDLALSTYQAVEGNNPSGLLSFCYSVKGQIFLDMGNTDAASEFALKSNEVLLALNENDSSAYGYTNHDRARIYYAAGKYLSAIDWEKKAIEFLKGNSSEPNQDVSAVLLWLGRAQMAAGYYDAALKSFHEDLDMLGQIFGTESDFSYHALAEIGKCYYLMFLHEGRDSLLLQSLEYFHNAEIVLRAGLKKHDSRNMRRKLLIDAHKLYGDYLTSLYSCMQRKIGSENQIKEKAWQVSETMHGYSLSASIQESNARQFAGIPSIELEKDSMLREELIRLEYEKQFALEYLKLSLNDSVILELNLKLTSQKEACRQSEQYFEQHYPDYHSLKYAPKTISIREAQALLSDRQCILEFFTADSAIFTFLIKKNDFRIYETPLNFPLDSLVDRLIHGITGFYNGEQLSDEFYEETLREYTTSAQKLYQKLVEPIEEQLLPELIIIPGDGMASLPFETLLSASPKTLNNFSTYPFWLHKHTIFYGYSASMYQQMVSNIHRKSPNQGLLGIAPYFFDESAQASRTSGTGSLPNSGKELQQIQQYVSKKSLALYGHEASKNKFLKMAGDYQILHLATHAKANQRDGAFCYLSFFPDSIDEQNSTLTAAELYNYYLNADMVVLSACETGLGETSSGDGVMGLASAFAYAGAKCIVSSLWQVNDKSTMQIMENYYRELQDGKPKNTALVEAKRSYIKSSQAQYAHPFFWAGFIGIGDFKAIKN
ncbi:MAG: CHAT domain-containing tetratricopeptide repeat protein [Saprospiraceae bacterium]